jgi:hypothetical protein
MDISVVVSCGQICYENLGEELIYFGGAKVRGLVEDVLDIQLVTLFHSIITELTLTDYKIPLRVYYGLVSFCLPPYIDILKVVLFMSCSADLLDLEYI